MTKLKISNSDTQAHLYKNNALSSPFSSNLLFPSLKSSLRDFGLVSRSERSSMARGFQAMQALAILGLFLFGNVVAEDMLFNGESLNSGEFLENGPYRFIMQADCNLVLYVNRNRALWNSATNGRGNSCRATLQNNGNLVVLSGNDVVWTSNSARGPNNYRLIVQTDGNVVIYGSALWATNTVQNSRKLL